MVIFPPISVCRPATKFPTTLRDRTTMPRTTPRFFVIRHPGNPKAVVTSVRSTFGMGGFPVDVVIGTGGRAGHYSHSRMGIPLARSANRIGVDIAVVFPHRRKDGHDVSLGRIKALLERIF